MEIIGNPNEFAIQYEITHAYENECFGSFVFYLGGEQIGRGDYEVWINACINWFKDFNKHKDARTYPNSHLLSKEELFYELYEKFYDGTSVESGDYLKIGTVTEVFHLDDTGDASFRDFVNVILLDEPQINRQRFIWRYYENEEVKKEFFIQMNMYETVSKQFCEQASFKWNNMLHSPNIR